MGKSWLFFKEYSWDNEEEKAVFGEGDDMGLTYQTTANLCAIFGHYDVYFPTIDVYKKQDVIMLKEMLIAPQEVVEVISDALEMLENEENPMIKDFGEEVKLFDEDDLKIKDSKRLNENVRYYLNLFKKISEEGKYIALEYE